MNLKTLLSTSALVAPALAVAHQMTVTEINGVVVKTDTDLAYIERRLPFWVGTFAPKDAREPIVDALERLSERVAKSGLGQVNVEHIATAIQAGIGTIEAQPDKMPPVGNGHGDQPHQSDHGQQTERRAGGGH